VSMKCASGQACLAFLARFALAFARPKIVEKVKRVVLQAIPSAVLLVFGRVLSEQTERR